MPASGLANLPDDALVVLVGPAGSGKSTWAARHFEPQEVLSSDAFRAMVAGDEADQSASADAFKVLHLVVRTRLRRAMRTIVDATNLTERARRSLLRLASGSRRPAVAIVFDLSLERCLAQNARRPDRRVAEAVVRRHHRQLQTTLPRLPREGYLDIILLRDTDIGPA